MHIVILSNSLKPQIIEFDRLLCRMSEGNLFVSQEQVRWTLPPVVCRSPVLFQMVVTLGETVLFVRFSLPLPCMLSCAITFHWKELFGNLDFMEDMEFLLQIFQVLLECVVSVWPKLGIPTLAWLKWSNKIKFKNSTFWAICFPLISP